MKQHLLYIALLSCFLFSSCIGEDKYNDTPEDNFEALWKIMDEHYCFFDYKKEVYGLDWDSVHIKYKALVTPKLTNDALFEILGNMLAELKDGHVNLYSSSNTARYWSWYEDYPRNFDETIQEKYLGTNYRLAGGIKYKILENNIGYMYYEDFSSNTSNSNLNEILQYLAICDGLIIDIRNNGGGILSNSSLLASHFTNKKVLTGYIQHKTGKGHSAFSSPVAIYLSPSSGVRWQKNVVVLTNRHVFSAANDFVNSMRILPNVTIMGDKTGGGSGLPFSSELPNGWAVRFSASPHYDSEMKQIEFGIEPDVKAEMSLSDQIKGIDTMIETAKAYLKK